MTLRTRSVFELANTAGPGLHRASVTHQRATDMLHPNMGTLRDRTMTCCVGGSWYP